MPADTPIRQQYLTIKRQHPDAILFFRLGDFYETFDDDARTVAAELDIVLTSRNVAQGKRVPMAGVPYHAAEGYIGQLISKGYKVAVCEQIGEQPTRGLMPRQVVRVVTPGTVVEDDLLDGGLNNYLAAMVYGEARAGIAYADITTGEFRATELSHQNLAEAVRELDRLSPAELIIGDGGHPCLEHGTQATAEAKQRLPMLEVLHSAITLYDQWRFDESICERALREHLQAASLAGFGLDDQPLAMRAAGVLVQYLQENQPSALTQLRRVSVYSTSAFMTLDLTTRRNLEITETIRSRGVRGSLLWVLDRTLTPMGARLLRRWLGEPLLDQRSLGQRLGWVARFHGDAQLREALRLALRPIGDIERLTGRVVQRIARPRDLTALQASLAQLPAVTRALSEGVKQSPLEDETSCLFSTADADALNDVADGIARALVDEPPLSPAAGRLFRRGYDAELDAIEDSVAAAREWVAALESVERERTGIRSLKVGYNKVFGYYLEVTHANSEAVPTDYIRKQTLVNAERYITPELKDKEALILSAEERIQEIEQNLYTNLLDELAQHAEALLTEARAISYLDVYASFADVAAQHGYTRPEISADDRIEIVAGRHPVVEQTLADALFVPNDTCLTPEESIHIITGPNMSGKSTYLRQVALIVLLAQIGSFVPAKRAHIGLVDRIFARVGAQDEIAAGQSTFMVEMVELANIMNHATSRSLLILDEIGRGTSTYDGISIAWAAVEHLQAFRPSPPRTLFATHYHELTDLQGFIAQVRNYNVAVKSDGQQVVFTHYIVPGGADRSYGIHVAQMAGLPRELIRRAYEILSELEGATRQVAVGTGPRVIKVKQLALFDSHPALEELRSLDVSKLTPLDALNTLARLQQQLDA
ncbi:MAG: DNA mismatch repair protein MutS [Chloroflexi bacterium]|mgnify:FL=1|nr:DNA mismatch repair protein MutS [Chloroflexota bacterium]